jgi:tetratricopeptide (TPR) repeat protein
LTAALLVASAASDLNAGEKEVAALHREGNQLYEKGEFAAAAEKFRAALLHGEDPHLRFNLGNALYGAGKKALAAQAYRAALAGKKDFPEASLNLGMVLFESRDWTGALKALEAARPNPQVWRIRATCFQALDDWEAALFALEGAVQGAPRDQDLRIALGSARYRLRRYAQAADSFRFAVHLAPADPKAHRLLGWALLGLDRRQDAAEALELALCLGQKPDPKVAEVLVDLYATAGLPGLAARVARRHLGPKPPVRLLLRLARLLRASKDPRAEKAVLRDILAQDPTHEEARLLSAEARLRTEPADAATVFKAIATSKNPALRARAFFGLGSATATKGGHAEAFFQKALAADPSLSPAHRELGRILFLAGKYEAAAARFRTALSLAPHDRIAAKWLGLALGKS